MSVTTHNVCSNDPLLTGNVLRTAGTGSGLKETRNCRNTEMAVGVRTNAQCSCHGDGIDVPVSNNVAAVSLVARLD